MSDIEMTDAEFKTLIDIGQACAIAMMPFSEGGDDVDTGTGAGQYEAFVTVGDIEYRMTISPHSRPSEVFGEVAGNA